MELVMNVMLATSAQGQPQLPSSSLLRQAIIHQQVLLCSCLVFMEPTAPIPPPVLALHVIVGLTVQVSVSLPPLLATQDTIVTPAQWLSLPVHMALIEPLLLNQFLEIVLIVILVNFVQITLSLLFLVPVLLDFTAPLKRGFRSL